VVGGDFQGLGIARSLGQQGIRVCVVDDERSISSYSRYTDHAVRVPNLRDEEGTVASLLDVGRRLGLEGAVLFPTRDETVMACAKRRDELAERFRVPVPPWDVTRWAVDKRLTYRLASTHGVPTPRGFTDDGSIEGFDQPLVVKPAFKPSFLYATGVKAWRVDNLQQLRDRSAQAAAVIPQDEVIVQEYVPGDGRCQYAFCALVRDGEPIASMVVNRRRQHPTQFGRASTFVRTVDMPEVEALSRRLLRALRYDGLVEMEFKLDPRDGQPKLLDINARTWGYHSLGQRAGVDFSALLYEQTVGNTVQTARAETGVGWIRLLTDLPVSVWEILRGRLGLRTLLRSLWECRAESVFSRRDPLPALAELALIPHLVRTRGFSLRDPN
jgi:predicted ATP-grasp superfamily ATP-dependent carboligase